MIERICHPHSKNWLKQLALNESLKVKYFLEYVKIMIYKSTLNFF
jgi:hypothetical protein